MTAGSLLSRYRKSDSIRKKYTVGNVSNYYRNNVIFIFWDMLLQPSLNWLTNTSSPTVTMADSIRTACSNTATTIEPIDWHWNAFYTLKIPFLKNSLSLNSRHCENLGEKRACLPIFFVFSSLVETSSPGDEKREEKKKKKKLPQKKKLRQTGEDSSVAPCRFVAFSREREKCRADGARSRSDFTLYISEIDRGALLTSTLERARRCAEAGACPDLDTRTGVSYNYGDPFV